MSKPKILIISQNFYPEIGSAANRIKNIFQLLQIEDYEVSVLTTEPAYPNRNIYKDNKFWNDDDLNSNPNIYRVEIKNKKYAQSIFNRLIYYLEFTFKMIFFVLRDKKKYDVVIATSPAIFIAFVGLLAKRKYKAKFILEIRDLWPESLKGVGVFNNKLVLKFFSLLEVYLYKMANHIIINSIGFKDYIVKKSGIKHEKITFIPNSARDYELEGNRSGEKDDDIFKVIYTGNLGLAQDVEFLKELVVKLSEKNIGLTIIGYGIKKNEFVQFIKDNDLKNVEIINPTTRMDCLEINRKHDVGVLSLNDKDVFDTVLPGKLIDYMTSGLPVVAAVSGISKKLIENYETGFVSKSRSADEILKYILMLKNNKELRMKMAKNSKQLIYNEYHWEKNIKSLMKIIDTNAKNVTKEKNKTSKVDTQ